MPVSWVSRGTRFGANQCGTRRSTEMNVTASPSPTTARAPMANGSDVVSASASCPVAINAAPATIKIRDPYRSSSRPAGTWAAAYTITCRTTKADSIPGLAAKRSAAFSPDTPSVVRWSTATM